MNIRMISLFQALLVTFLWSTSFIIIKKSLSDITPLLFAAYRYNLASFILLLIVVTNQNFRYQLKTISIYWWKQLILYGIIFIFLTQGAGYLTLTKLPAITLSFTLNFTTILVVVIGAILLKEKTTTGQLIFVLTSIGGAFIYFYPLDLHSDTSIGYLYVLLALLSNVLATVHGRYINQHSQQNPLIVTSVSMTVGSLFLLVTAALIEGLVIPEPSILFAVLWLGIINTALAFTLWNKVLTHLQALEASIILNTILPQITVMSYFFLDERPTNREWVGLVIIIISVSIVQYLGMKRPRSEIIMSEQTPHKVI